MESFKKRHSKHFILKIFVFKPILHHKHLKCRVMMMHRPLPAQMCTHQEAQLRLSSVTATLTNEGSACVHGHYSELAARSALALQRLNKGDFTC